MKKVALIGRTNVGKSTLFNRLTGSKEAIVHNLAGVTRDRKEGIAHLFDLEFTCIDTAGLEDKSSLADAMWKQSLEAIKEADILIAVFDAREGIHPLDKQLVKTLRKSDKPCVMVINKAESFKTQDAVRSFSELAFERPIALSAEHALGIEDLYDALKEYIEPESFEEKAEVTDEERAIKIAIIGRPNAGKSTLINKLIGKDRLLTGAEAGVTRDAIEIPWSYKDRKVILVDTAGIRKNMKIINPLEKLAKGDAEKALNYAQIVILTIDAASPLDKQDLLLASQVINEGRGLVIAINKWDTVRNPAPIIEHIKDKLESSLQQVKGLPIVYISAKTGKGLRELMDKVFEIYSLWNKRISTNPLNRFLQKKVESHPTPLARNGRHINLKYITQAKTRPPTFIIFSSNPDKLPESYLRYLSNGLRETFKLAGVPIRIFVRKRENPFANEAVKRGKRK